MSLSERLKTNPRARFLVVATTLAVAACGSTGTRGSREGSRTPAPLKPTGERGPTPEPGIVTEGKLGDWDPIIDTFIEEIPLVKTSIQKGYEDGIDFFAVSVTHRHGTPNDDKDVMILPISPDLPEPIRGVDQTIFYAIGTRDGRLLPFPERSHIGFLRFTPSTIIGREVHEEKDAALLNKNVTVVQTRVLGPGSQGRMEPGLGVVLLKGNPPERIDTFLQTVRKRFLEQKPALLLEVTEAAPLDLLYFPAKIIEKDGKILYTRSDPTA